MWINKFGILAINQKSSKDITEGILYRIYMNIYCDADWGAVPEKGEREFRATIWFRRLGYLSLFKFYFPSRTSEERTIPQNSKVLLQRQPCVQELFFYYFNLKLIFFSTFSSYFCFRNWLPWMFQLLPGGEVICIF